MPVKIIEAEVIVTHYCENCDTKIYVDRRKHLDKCPFCKKPIEMTGVES